MDQIVYEILSNNFRIDNGYNFDPEIHNLAPPNKKVKYYRCIYKNKDLYTPQLTIIYRRKGKEHYFSLRIQVSVPKILYRSNYYEVNVGEEGKFYDVLRSRCRVAGVSLLNNISNYEVIGFDPCKNVVLTKGSTASQCLRYLFRNYTNKSVSFDHRSFKNKGQAIYYHKGKWNYVMYDKVADLGKPKTKRFDKENYDKKLSKKLVDKKIEILRIELHGRDRKKLRKFFKKYYPTEDEVESWMLFNEVIWLDIIRAFFIEEVLKDNKLVQMHEQSTMVWYEILASLFPQLSDAKIRAKLGLVEIIQDREGLEVYRRTVERNKGVRTWQRIYKEAKELQLLLYKNNPDYYSFIYDIDKALWYKGCQEMV